MVEQLTLQAGTPRDDLAETGMGPSLEIDKKKKKKRDKVRSAWISFAGRIVAQLVGAAATVGLGVAVLHNLQAAGPRAVTADQAAVGASGTTEPARSLQAMGVAVMPMESFSADVADQYFADGMTAALIATLARTDGLHVISRTSSMQFKGQRQTVREIAYQLGVQWVLEGAVVRAGDHVHVTTQLIDASTDQHAAWAELYERSGTDILALQVEVAGAIADAVGAVLRPDRAALRAGQPYVSRPGL